MVGVDSFLLKCLVKFAKKLLKDEWIAKYSNSFFLQVGGGGCGILHWEYSGSAKPGEPGPEHGWDLGAEEVMGSDSARPGLNQSTNRNRRSASSWQKAQSKGPKIRGTATPRGNVQSYGDRHSSSSVGVGWHGTNIGFLLSLLKGFFKIFDYWLGRNAMIGGGNTWLRLLTLKH